MPNTPGDDAIHLQNIAKIYRKTVHALRGISMHVRKGEVFGLLGPNGAGKSTLVKIMMTVVRPTHAEGEILGHPIGHKPTLARIGYLPENHRFPRYLTGRQTIEFFSALANVDRPTRKKRAAELLDTVGMTAWADTKIGQYSKGMLQRVGLATALGADPDLLVLDEPTDGVDPAGRRDIRDVLLKLRAQKKTVFINSHQLSELETVCDRVAILIQGQVARQGTIDELSFGQQHYAFELAAQENLLPKLTAAFPTAFPRFDPAGRTRGKIGDSWCEFDSNQLKVGRTDPAEVQEILDALRRQQIVVRRMMLVRPTLEDLFFDAITDPQTGLHSGPGARLGGRP